MSASHTPGPISITKCPCGHRSCNQHILSTQGGVGFSIEDATLYATEPALVEALERIDAHVSHGKMGDWSIALDEIRQLARAAIAKAKGQSA